MATEVRPETKARSFGENIESDLAPKFIRVVENAAVACARTMGRGDRDLSDKVATESMRMTMDSIPMRGNPNVKQLCLTFPPRWSFPF